MAGGRVGTGGAAPAASTAFSTCSTMSWKVLCSSLRPSSQDSWRSITGVPSLPNELEASIVSCALIPAASIGAST
jgi:hypothetical protein